MGTEERTKKKEAIKNLKYRGASGGNFDRRGGGGNRY